MQILQLFTCKANPHTLGFIHQPPSAANHQTKMNSTEYPALTARINVVREDRLTHTVTDTPDRLYEFWKTIIAEQPDFEEDKESVVVILLNSRYVPYSWNRVSVGTASESSAHPREIMRPVIVGAASAFAIMHNHPSGDPSPSRADEIVTRRMVEVAAIMQIPFLDHVIVGEPAPHRMPYYSFREVGLIP